MHIVLSGGKNTTLLAVPLSRGSPTILGQRVHLECCESAMGASHKMAAVARGDYKNWLPHLKGAQKETGSQNGADIAPINGGKATSDNHHKQVRRVDLKKSLRNYNNHS